MSSDFDDAVEFLTNHIQERPDLPIALLFGSGLSVPVVPGAKDMAKQFLAAANVPRSDEEHILRGSPGVAYRQAAMKLKQRRGAPIVDRVIRAAVESARAGASDEWRITKAQAAMSRLVARIPKQQMSALWTTNFDPLAECALDLEGVDHFTCHVSTDQFTDLETIVSRGVPVVHLHGFWNRDTMSTADQLERRRDDFESSIRRALLGTLVVVVAYGGWDDSFTRTLDKLVSSGELAQSGGGLIWLNYSMDSQDVGPIFGKILGARNVNFYNGIDAADFFTAVLAKVSGLERESLVRLPGWMPLGGQMPPTASADEILEYCQGIHPSWATVRSAPILSSAREAQTLLHEAMSAQGDAVLALVAPAGEGKSTALRQLALQVQSEGWNLLYREPGAPAISASWVAEMRAMFGRTILFIDEADLVLNDIRRTLITGCRPDEGRIIWVLAVHTHYRSTLAGMAAGHAASVTILDFHGPTEVDAFDIAGWYRGARVLPPPYDTKSTQDIANMIIAASGGAQGSSLLGGMLDLWASDDLVDRVEDLMVRLEKLELYRTNMRQILIIIAVVQVAWDLWQEDEDGVSFDVLGEIIGISSGDVLRFAVDPLGREVGVSVIGSRVYVRHGRIAEYVVKIARQSGELNAVLGLIGEAGGRLRLQDQESQFHNAYRLAAKMNGHDSFDASEAHVAAYGAVRGATEILEPRVNLMKVARDQGRFEFSTQYARAVWDHRSSYSDSAIKVRGFLVEWAMAEYACGNSELALGLVCASVSDLRGTHGPRKSHIEYAMTTARSMCRTSSDQKVKELAKAVVGIESYLRRGSSGVTLAQIVDEFRRSSYRFGIMIDGLEEWRFVGMHDLLRAKDSSSGGY